MGLLRSDIADVKAMTSGCEKVAARGRRMETAGGTPGQASLLSRALASEWIPPGLFFIVLGAAALWISRDYPLGNLNRMGPGYFPRMLSMGMIGLGVLIVRQGLRELAGAKGLTCSARPQLLAHSALDGGVRTFSRAARPRRRAGADARHRRRSPIARRGSRKSRSRS